MTSSVDVMRCSPLHSINLDWGDIQIRLTKALWQLTLLSQEVDIE